MRRISCFLKNRKNTFSKILLIVVIAALVFEVLPQSASLNNNTISKSNSDHDQLTPLFQSNDYTYNVTFNEQGLPITSGILQIWSLNISNASGFKIYHIDSSNITVSVQNGSYSFQASTSAGYYATPSKGTFTVNGANLLLNIKFSSSLYRITFSETGLGNNQNPGENMIPSWNVSLRNASVGTINQISNSNNLSFQVPNGTYDFVITSPSNYTVSPFSGKITVNGRDYVESLIFSSKLFRLTFNESGLPFIGEGSSWYVSVTTENGYNLNQTSQNSSIVFSLPNGTYSFEIGKYSNYTANPTHGNLVIAGSNYNVPVYFSRNLYLLEFTETGLRSGNGGMLWGVTIINSTSHQAINKYSKGTDIKFTVPNGTYEYQADRLNNYSAFPYNGSGIISINKQDSMVNIEFVPDIFFIQFVEKGLPDISGHVTVWSVSVNKTIENSSGSEIMFMEPIIPGKTTTYYYTVQPVSQFVVSTNSSNSYQAPSISQLVINDTYVPFVKIINITFTYSQGTASFKYASTSSLFPDLAFSESGLPAGTSWSVGLNNTTSKITAIGTSNDAQIYFSTQNIPAGKYYFSVYPAGDYIPIVNRSNNVTWNGQDFLNISVVFVSEVHTVEFMSYGLPQLSNWTLDITSGYDITTSYTSNGNPIYINITNGHYLYRILPAGTYKPEVSNGYLSVNNSSVNAYPSFSVNFIPYYYRVSLNESGLPSTSVWSVALVSSNGTVQNQSLGANPVSFNVPNGTYYYNFLSGGNTIGFHSSISSGLIVVNGANRFKLLPFVNTTHLVTFTETGLPRGSNWGVILDGIQLNSGGYGSIQEILLNGTYFYSVIPHYGFQASNRSGSVTVNGNNVNINVNFIPNLYQVKFIVSGLPASVNWSLVMNGLVYQLKGNSTFYLSNGTYVYYLSEVTNVYTYYPFASGGYFIVNGTSHSINVSYRDFVYTLSLEEIGLPNNANWSIQFDNLVLYSNSHNFINLTLQNGTFYLFTMNYNAYYPVKSIIIVTIQGSSSLELVKYAISLYQVTFIENNLPTGFKWNLSLKGLYNYSSLTYSVNHVYFNLTNGSYLYSVTSLNKSYLAPTSGAFAVSGAPLTIYLNFTEVTYNITFKESGLPLKTTWSINLNGKIDSTNNTTLSIMLPNGTYDYSIGGVSGYHITSTSYGNFTVNGKSVTLDVTYAKNQTSTTPPPAPPPTPAKKPFTLPLYFYEVLIIVIIAGIGIAVTIYTQQKKKINK